MGKAHREHETAARRHLERSEGPMSSIDLTTRPTRPRVHAALLAGAVALLLVGGTLVVLLARAMSTPSTVARVTVVNHGDYGLDVELRDQDAARVLFGRALPDGNTSRHEVLDLGDDWTFVFSRDGLAAATVDVSRDELARADWHVTVPDDVATKLRDAGQIPYPEEGDR
jgi:hypothetical protein